MSVGGELAGRTIVVTRAVDQAGSLSSMLSALGAGVVEISVIQVADPADGGAALRASLDRLSTYDWLVFTSANAAIRVLDAVAFRPGSITTIPPIAVVGPATAAAVTARGFSVALLPTRNDADGLVDAFGRGPGRVLFARAAEGNDLVVSGLTAKGFAVDLVVAYRTVAAPKPPAQLIHAAAAADAIAFTSSSTVTRYLELVGHRNVAPVVVSIGPATTATAEQAGLVVTATADPHTLLGLVAALCTALGSGE